MAAAESHPDPFELDPLEERDQAIHHARLRLTHLEIETHRIKADLARLEACQEDDKADRLADSISGPRIKIARDDSPAILRLDPAQTAITADTQRSTITLRQPSEISPHRNTETSPASRELPARKKELPRQKVVDRPIANSSSLSPAKPSQSPRLPIPRRKTAWRSSPAWLLSILVHAAIILVATLCTFATIKENPVFLTAGNSQLDESAIPELAEFVMKPIIPDETLRDDLPAEISEFDNLDAFTEELFMPFDSEATSQFDASASTDLLATDLGALMAGIPAEGKGSGSAAGGRGGKEGTDASFFGAKSQGKRFVFVVDNSGSMADGRMETTLMELQRSVEAMKEDQLFSIIFYSDQVYPLFYPESVTELVPATRENKQKVAQWLPTVEMCLGGRLREAMDLALTMEPQVVYLLSDGDIRSEPLMRHLTEPNDWKFVIHTFGMTVRNPSHLAKLSAIATSHGGQFIPVNIHPAAAQMSRQRPVKYNREPGLVWGTKVRPWN